MVGLIDPIHANNLTIVQDVVNWCGPMSAKKFASAETFHQSITVEGRQSRLELSSEAVVVHKSGIEFRSPVPFSPWTEMTVALQSPRDGSRVQCSGVVIGCSGNKHTGYGISLVFTSVSRQAQSRLNVMARSPLGPG